jgi:hypothetical protein
MGFFFQFLYILLSLTAPSDVFPEMAPLRLALWTGVLGLLFSGAALVTKGAAFARLPQFWALAGFMGVMCVSTILGERSMGGAGEVLAGFGVSLTMFLLLLWNIDTLQRLKWTAIAIVVSAVLLSLQGLVSFATGWDAPRVLYVHTDVQAAEESRTTAAEVSAQGSQADLMDSDENPIAAGVREGSLGVRVRGNGVMQDPNDLALGLVTTLPFCWLAWRKGARGRNLVCAWLPTGLIVTTMFYTQSRGGVLALLAVTGLLFSRRMGTLKTALIVGALAVIMFAAHFTGGRSLTDESTEGRIDAWGEGFHMFLAHPLLGVGYNQFTEYNRLTAHNSYLLCFAETGLAGYFFWTSMLVACILQVSALMKIPGTGEAPENVRRWASALQLAMCGYIVGAFFLSRTYVYVFYMLTAMICGLTVIAWKQGLQVRLPATGTVFKYTVAAELASIAGIYTIVRINNLI